MLRSTAPLHYRYRPRIWVTSLPTFLAPPLFSTQTGSHQGEQYFYIPFAGLLIAVHAAGGTSHSIVLCVCWRWRPSSPFTWYWSGTRPWKNHDLRYWSFPICDGLDETLQQHSLDSCCPKYLLPKVTIEEVDGQHLGDLTLDQI